MAQSNEQGSDELREQVRAIIEDTAYIDYGEPDTAEQIEAVMQLILADRKQHELEARKEQIMQDWNSLDNFCDHHDESEELAWRDSRLKELGQS